MATQVETSYYNYLTQVTSTITLEEFSNLLITDDNFDTEWSNGCTRPLTFDERYVLAENSEAVRIAKSAKYGDSYINTVLNDLNIPKRTLI